MDSRYGNVEQQLVDSASAAGINVVFWSFRQMEQGMLKEISAQQYKVTCQNIINVNNAFRQNNLQCPFHFISVGGWDYTFPCDKCDGSPEDYRQAFSLFNKKCMEMDSSFQGIAGLDIDWEGHSVDEGKAGQTNVWTPEDVLKMAEIQKLIKGDGFKLSTVAPESYLNPSLSDFNLRLDNADSWKADFPYHARNLYAPFELLVPADLVMIQFYEGWTDTTCELYSKGSDKTLSSLWADNYPKDQDNVNFRIPGSKNGETQDLEIKALAILQHRVKQYTNGWNVDFGNTFAGHQAHDLDVDKVEGTKPIAIPGQKLVMGYANIYALNNYGWGKSVDPYKNIWVRGKIIAAVECCSKRKGLDVKGFTYWAASHDLLWTKSQQPDSVPDEVKNFLTEIDTYLAQCEGDVFSDEMDAMCKEADALAWEPVCA
jgi:hypothetical protein